MKSLSFKQPLRVLLLASSVVMVLGGCATENSRSLEVQKVAAHASQPVGPRLSVAIGQFGNRTNFQRGIFSDGIDRLGNQAKTVLSTHLQQSNRFNLLDRTHLEEMKAEAEILGEAQELEGARFVITGDVTEFGRRVVGDQQLFGILGRGKSQVAYAKVALQVVDIRTSQVIYSSQGAGEYSLSNREVVGFGGTAGYDATLNGKVLDLAIREAVDALVAGRDAGSWPPAP